MTTVVQSVPIQPLNGAASWTFTIAGTGAANLLVVKAGVQQFGGSNPSSVTVTDNGSGNVWSTAIFKAGTGGDRFSFICYCLSVSAGTTSVTVTPNTGTFYGSSGIEEVSGGPWALDQTGSAVSTVSGTNTATCSAVDVGTTDFVAAAMQTDGGQSNMGISDPPTGYTSSSVEQDDSSFAGSETCYRINSLALTDTVTWTYNASASAAGLPVAIASFKVSGGGGGALSGTGSLTFGQSGALKGAGALVGSSALTFGQTGALKGAGALAGSAALLFGQSGALTGSGVLAGTAGIVFGSSANLIGAGALSGSAGIAFGATGTLTPPSGSLAGTATLTFNQVGALTGAGALIGSAAITFGQTGSLTGAGAIAGSSGIVFNATGMLTPPGAMQGTAGLSFGQSGSLTGSAALSGEADFFFTASGAMIQPDVATATPGRRLRLRAQVRGETEEEKYARRIEQGIIVERFEALPALRPKPIDRTIERLTSQVEAARAEVADYRALADRAQNRAKAKTAAAKLRRLDAALVAAQTQLMQAQTEEHDIVFVASVLANL